MDDAIVREMCEVIWREGVEKKTKQINVKKVRRIKKVAGCSESLKMFHLDMLVSIERP